MQGLLSQIAVRLKYGLLPNDYVVLDCETTGINPNADVAVQWGACFVSGRRPLSRFSQIVKRGKSFPMHPKAVAVHGITQEVMEKQGADPIDVVCGLVESLEWFRSQGYLFVGHNIYSFDARIFERESEMAGCPFKFGPDEVVDTGMLVKAAQLGMYFEEGEDLGHFYKKVANRRAAGVYWSLDRHCVPAYKLHRFVDKDTLDNMHDASVDCLMTHYLLDTLRDTTFGGAYKLEDL